MFRFFALIWDKSDPEQAEACDVLSKALRDSDASFHTSLDCHGVRILCSSAGSPTFAVHLLANNGGALLGAAFKRHSDLSDEAPDPQAEFDIPATNELISSRGQSLISQYWGDYVALVLEAHSHANQARAVHVIKDPTGNLPCYVTTWRKVEVLFSCLSDCVRTGLMSFTANRAYVASRISSAGYDYVSCARAPIRTIDSLNEVTQVHRGECVTIRVGGGQLRSRQFYWTPTQFARPEFVIDSVLDAMQALRATVRSATATLSRRHDGVLVRLSGGLDSSIVSGCLKATNGALRVRSYAYFVSGGRSDERRWARLAAEHCGYDLIEVPLEPWNIRLESPAPMQPTVAPVWAALAYRGRDPIEQEIFRQEPYTAVFTGDGGDSSFGGECIPYAVDDFLRLKGLSKGLVTLASQVALRTGTLTWRVLGSAIRRRMRGAAMKDDSDKLLIGSALVAEHLRGVAFDSARHPHPWFSDCEDVPWHVIYRLGDLIAPAEFYNPFIEPAAFSPYIASPLYSQPVLELCLRIPTYTHLHEGRDRGLARVAFKTEIPEQIRRRQWKDRFPGAMETIVRQNRAYLCDVLVGGVLCKEGFLDRIAVQNALSGRFSTRQFYVGELMNYLHLELWLRNFASAKAAAMAA
jgi:asparagine synthase (glutamine-hydrolysing)